MKDKLDELKKQSRMSHKICDQPDGVNGVHGLVELIDYVGGLENKKALEVGCYRGISSETFLLHKPAEMHFVDCWGLNEDYTQANKFIKKDKTDWVTIKKEFETRIEPYTYQTKIRIIHDLSVNAARNTPDESFDFIYIDGDHDYDPVLTDIKSWYPKLKPGGWFCGHDYSHLAQVKDAFDEYFTGLEITSFNDSSCAIRKLS